MNHSIIYPFIFLLLFSCSKSNDVSDELLLYINEELKSIEETEASIISKYDSVSGKNFTDDDTMFSALGDEIIPAYSEFIESLESISTRLETREVRELHEIYIEGANTQHAGFSMILAALDAQDYGLISKANEKMDKGRSLIRKWQGELKFLCKQNNVELSDQD